MHENKLFTSRGHLTDDAVYLYVDALKLAKKELLPGEVREHVEECVQCKRAIQELYDVVRQQDYSSLGPHPYFDQKKIPIKPIHRTITRLAAAIVIGIGLVLLAYFYLPDTDTPLTLDEPVDAPEEIEPQKTEPAPPDITEPDIAPPVPEEPRELYAANFEPMPFYENLVDQQFRSHLVRVQSPEIDEEITNEVHFSWDTRVPMQVHIKILNNNQDIVWQTSTEEQHVSYDTSELEPGIYYWRLENDEELLYVGKFTIPLP